MISLSMFVSPHIFWWFISVNAMWQDKSKCDVMITSSEWMGNILLIFFLYQNSIPTNRNSNSFIASLFFFFIVISSIPSIPQTSILMRQRHFFPLVSIHQSSRFWIVSYSNDGHVFKFDCMSSNPIVYLPSSFCTQMPIFSIDQAYQWANI